MVVSYKEELHDRVCVVHNDVDVEYLREPYNCNRYFPPTYSRFTPIREITISTIT